MKFRELLEQNYCARSDVIDANALGRLLPTTPADIIEQFYSHHGRNNDFQTQYGEVKISNIIWVKVSLPASEIVQCSYYEPFSKWYLNAENRAAEFPQKSWACIDIRKDVVEHWKTYYTWLKLPIFLQGNILGLASQLRLVEGHTRVGLLSGLVKAGIIAMNSKHEIWLGQHCV
jgi:hypothetical protein